MKIEKGGRPMTYQEFLSKEREALSKRIRLLLEGFPMAALVSVLPVKAGDNALSQGEPRSDILVLISGWASTVSRHTGYTTYAFDEFAPVYIFGELEALSGHSRIVADVRAKTSCRFLALREADYLRWIQSDIKIMQRRVRSVVGTLTSQADQERGALFLSSRQRIKQFLSAYYERHAKSAKDGSVTVRQTRAAIAEETGFSLRTVNRVVRQLHNDGEIALYKGKITLTERQYRALQ